jgi:hypothetical protein
LKDGRNFSRVPHDREHGSDRPRCAELGQTCTQPNSSGSSAGSKRGKMEPQNTQNTQMDISEDRINLLSKRIIGCALTVLHALGTGFLQKLDENALVPGYASLGSPSIRWDRGRGICC